MNNELLNLLPKCVFFVTPEISQALGIIELVPQVKIITGQTHPLIPYLRENGNHIFCLEETINRENFNWKNSASILACEESLSYIKEKSQGKQPAVACFKPSPKLDLICKGNGFLQLSGQPSLNRLFENKLLFNDMWSGKVPTVPAIIDYSNNLLTNNLALGWLDQEGVVIQHERGWAGQGTIICKNRDELKSTLQNENNNKIKVSKYINGSTYTVNFVIGKNRFWIGEIAKQINSPTPDFGPSESTTCGRKWPSGLSNKVKLDINNLVTEVCYVMQTKGYRGFAGVDLIIDDEDRSIYLLEVNPRLTASESFLTRLELNNNLTPLSLLHYLSLLDIDSEYENSVEYAFDSICGTQLLVRNTRINGAKVCKALIPGKYIWLEDELIFSENGYVKLSTDFVIWSAGNKEISFNEELIKIETIGDYDFKSQKLLNEFIKLKNSII